MFSIMDVYIKAASESSKSLNLILVENLLKSDLSTGKHQRTCDVDVQ